MTAPPEPGSGDDPGQDPEEIAERCGCRVFYSDPLSLQLDLDSTDAVVLYEAQLRRYCERQAGTDLPAFAEVRRWASRGGNTHVVLRSTRPLTVLERIHWQALFGSDPVREMMNVLRMARGEEHPIRLFIPKPAEV